MFQWWHKSWVERTPKERIMGIVVAIVIAAIFIAIYLYFNSDIKTLIK